MEYSWEIIALRAIKIGFNKNEEVDQNKSIGELQQSKSLLEESIKLQPDKAWPYIKLADLAQDKKEKIKIYKESLIVEPTDFVKARLYDLLIDVK